jgi:hypothetical protein
LLVGQPEKIVAARASSIAKGVDDHLKPRWGRGERRRHTQVVGRPSFVRPARRKAPPSRKQRSLLKKRGEGERSTPPSPKKIGGEEPGSPPPYPKGYPEAKKKSLPSKEAFAVKRSPRRGRAR